MIGGWLEYGYYNIIVSNYELIMLIKFGSQSCTYLWKRFVNRLYLILHVCKIFFLRKNFHRKPNTAHVRSTKRNCLTIMLRVRYRTSYLGWNKWDFRFVSKPRWRLRQNIVKKLRLKNKTGVPRWYVFFFTLASRCHVRMQVLPFLPAASSSTEHKWKFPPAIQSRDTRCFRT